MRNLIVFPRRGDPPPIPAGYAKTNDPYVFELPWVPCRHRVYKSGGGCGGCGSRPANEHDHTAWCELKDEPCDRVACHVCTLPEKGP